MTQEYYLKVFDEDLDNLDFFNVKPKRKKDKGKYRIETFDFGWDTGSEYLLSKKETLKIYKKWIDLQSEELKALKKHYKKIRMEKK